MSDSSRHKMYVVPETVYGTTPDTPTLDVVRLTGTTLGLSKSPQQSEELNANRQLTDFRHGTKQVGGDINFELTFLTMDVLIAAALGGSWVQNAATEEITISAVAADSGFHDSADGFIDAGYEVGDIITVSGFTDPANNGNFKITTVLAGSIHVTDVDDVPVVLVDEAAGDAVTIGTQEYTLLAGVERDSFSFLRHFTDQASGDKPFYRYVGCQVSGMSLAITPDKIITGTLSIMGRDAITPAETAPAGSTFNAATTSRAFNAFGGVVKEGGTAIGVMTELTFNLDNGMEPRFVIGDDKSLEPSIGRSMLTGSLGAYFEDSALIEKFYSETPSSVEFTTQDPSGNEYTFLLPNLSLTGGQPDTSGQGAIPLNIPFTAIMDADLQSQIKITRRAALA